MSRYYRGARIADAADGAQSEQPSAAVEDSRQAGLLHELSNQGGADFFGHVRVEGLEVRVVGTWRVGKKGQRFIALNLAS